MLIEEHCYALVHKWIAESWQVVSRPLLLYSTCGWLKYASVISVWCGVVAADKDDSWVIVTQTRRHAVVLCKYTVCAPRVCKWQVAALAGPARPGSCFRPINENKRSEEADASWSRWLAADCMPCPLVSVCLGHCSDWLDNGHSVHCLALLTPAAYGLSD